MEDIWGRAGISFSYFHSKSQDVVFKDNFKLLKTGDPDGKYYMLDIYGFLFR